MKRVTKKKKPTWVPYTQRVWCDKYDGHVGNSADQRPSGMRCRIISEADYRRLLRLVGRVGRGGGVSDGHQD